MERNIQTRAIVIGSRRLGDLHKSVTLLSEDLGQINVTIYGGRKGKNSASAPLFSAGTFWLYYNPVKQDYSLKDCQYSLLGQGISSELKSTWTASYLCELVQRAGTGEAYSLLLEAFSILDEDPSLAQRVIISFTWAFLELNGVAPDLTHCPSCDRQYSENEVLLFSHSLNAPVCEDCGDKDSSIKLPPGARRFLWYTSSMELKEAVNVPLSQVACDRIRVYMLKYAQLFAQTPLKTLTDFNLLDI